MKYQVSAANYCEFCWILIVVLAKMNTHDLV